MSFLEQTSAGFSVSATGGDSRQMPGPGAWLVTSEVLILAATGDPLDQIQTIQFGHIWLLLILFAGTRHPTRWPQCPLVSMSTICHTSHTQVQTPRSDSGGSGNSIFFAKSFSISLFLSVSFIVARFYIFFISNLCIFGRNATEYDPAVNRHTLTKLRHASIMCGWYVMGRGIVSSASESPVSDLRCLSRSISPPHL